MAQMIALLRGINVGGNKAVAMQHLRELLEGMGFVDVRTLLQSGNAIFKTKTTTAPERLEKMLDAEIRKRLSTEADFFVRTAGEWRDLIARNPFPAEAKKDPAHLIALCLRTEPTTKQLSDLRTANKGPERIEAAGRTAYVFFPEGQGRSKLSNAVLEKYIGRCTGRNWNTVLKLEALISK